MRKLVSLVLLLSLAAMPLMAERRRGSSRPSVQPTSTIDGGVVSGAITGVSGNLVSLADGLVVLDVSDAEIVTAGGTGGTIDDLRVGAVVLAILSGAPRGADGALVAKVVAVSPAADVTLTGAVESIDLSQSVLAVVGREIRVTAETSFGGGWGGGVSGLHQLVPGQIVVVQADAEGETLVARSVLRLSPLAGLPQFVLGTVRSIGPASWIVEDEKGNEITVLIDAQTKIAGAPRVGDRVAILLTNGPTGQVALAIMPVGLQIAPGLPLPQVLRGVVKSTGTVWVLTLEDGTDATIHLTWQTVFVGNPQVGDRVTAFTMIVDGKRTAYLVIRV